MNVSSSSRLGPWRWLPQPSTPVRPGLAGWAQRRPSRGPANRGWSRRRQSPRTATDTRSSLICRPAEEARTTLNGPTAGGRSGPPVRQPVWQPGPTTIAGSRYQRAPSRSHRSAQRPGIHSKRSVAGRWAETGATTDVLHDSIGGSDARLACDPGHRGGRHHAPIHPGGCPFEPACQKCALSGAAVALLRLPSSE